MSVDTLLAYERSEDRYGNEFFVVFTDTGDFYKIPRPPDCPPSYNGEAYTESTLSYLGFHKNNAYFTYKYEESSGFFVIKLFKFEPSTELWTTLDPDMASSFSPLIGEDVSGSNFGYRVIKTDQYESELQRTSNIFLKAGVPIFPIGPIRYNLSTLEVSISDQFAYLADDHLYCDGFIADQDNLYVDTNLFVPLFNIHEATKDAATEIGADPIYWPRPSLISFSEDNTTLALFNQEYFFTVDLSSLQVSVFEGEYSSGCTSDKNLTRFLNQSAYNSYVYDRTGSVLDYEFGTESAIHTNGIYVGTTVEREVPAPGESWNDIIKVHEITNLDTGVVVAVSLSEDARFFASGPTVSDAEVVEPVDFWTGFKQSIEVL